MAHADSSLCDLTATEMVAGLNEFLWSAVDLATAHLERIDTLNSTVNAIVTHTPELALASAATIDQRLATGQPVLLAGVPLAFKDTHDVAGVRTTYGSPLFADYVPTTSELQVSRLLAAGVVCLGKTNVPEFAAGAHSFNTLFPSTTNPFDHTLSAGGSTGGGGAAIAARLMPVSDGSDMAGSIRIPAAFNNVLGLRP